MKDTLSELKRTFLFAFRMKRSQKDRSALIALLSLLLSSKVAFAEITDARTILESLEFGAWAVETGMFSGQKYCGLHYEPGNSLSVFVVSEGINGGLRFVSEKWNFRKRLAPASLTTGTVFPSEGGFIVADGVAITDPHAEFEKQSLYLEMPIEMVSEALLEMSKASANASIINGNGKKLASLKFSGAKKPVQAWLNCVKKL